ncbi:MAG: serine protease [Granulosicoccus sp.]
MPVEKHTRDNRSLSKVLVLLGTLFFVAGSSFLAAQDQPASDIVPIGPSARIVGGVPTSIEQVPATVALLNRSRVELDGDLFQAQFCGGTVIASRWVLTAAHCVVDVLGKTMAADRILVLTGSEDLDNPINQPIPVLRIIAHPGYISVEQGRDIALLELEFDSLVQPIPLDTLPVELDEQAFIAGWGAVNAQSEGQRQSFPKQLRGAFVNMTPGANCGTLFPSYRGFTNETIICAGAAAGGRDSCQGDSGGPLYRVNVVENTVSAITGITSWGISCGVASNPGIYTNVSSYINWIQGSIGGQTISEQQFVPVNDSPPNETPTSAPPLIANDAPSSPVDGDSIFGGVLWAGMLPLLSLLAWRRRKNLRGNKSTDEKSSKVSSPLCKNIR